MKEWRLNYTPINTFLVVFFLVLFALKVTETGVVANWSWWWITAPLWGPIAFLGISMITGLALVMFIEFIKFLIDLWTK